MNIAVNRKLSVDDLKSTISSLSLQEQLNSFVSIVDRILNVDGIDNYWDLISKKAYKEDYDKILEFLSPGGQFMDLLLKDLPTDKSMFSYEFSVYRLSPCTQRLISTNNAPFFIASKLHSKNHGPHNNILILNAFEYYMFSFFSYIYHPSVTKRIDWNGATDSIYCQLVFRYLDLFLFNVTQSGLLMQLAVQSRTRSSFNPAFARSPNGSFSSFATNHSFNESIINGTRFLTKNIKNTDMTELYFTDTLVQIVLEFWLNFQSESMVSSPNKTGLSPRCSTPSVDQVCLVRVFLKHAYHFSYANCVSHLTPGSQIECDFFAKMNLYRQQILPKILIPKLYSYLHFCFSVWPADLSFKIVLETWLSAIQPWRYTDSAHHLPDQENGSMIVVDEWSAFIRDNLDLYSKLLLSFVRRSLKMDLSVLRNGQMLFRVAKVLSQSNLARHVNLDSRTYQGHAPVESIWTEIHTHTSLLFAEIDRTLLRLEIEDVNTPVSWWQSLWDGLNSELLSTNSPRRLITYLAQSRSLLGAVLALEHSTNVCRSADRNDYVEFKNSQPEHTVTYRGSELTDFGRFQVSHGLCKLEPESRVDYYARPVCSNEVTVLVPVCSRLSGLVISQFHESIRASCLRPDLVGRVTRFLLIHQRMPIIDSPHSPHSPPVDLTRWIDTHTPHLRIRFLANKAFLFWFAVLFLLLHVTMDVGPVSVLLLSSLAYLLLATLYVALSGYV